jgi:3-oxoacyl-[acyl-carrier protein] reductase
MSARLDGIVAVVTGAGRGLGRAVAQRYAAEGAHVVAADIDGAAVRETAALGGGSIAPVEADTSDEAALDALADRAEALGTLGVWVNNAGITRPAMLHKMAVEDFDAVWHVNGRAVFLGVQVAARRMIAAGAGGAIVNVTSSAGLNGTIGQINYSAAKGAVTAMTKSAAR